MPLSQARPPGRSKEVHWLANYVMLSRGTSLEAALFEFLEAETCSGAPYCTDGGQFKQAGIDSLICGPGDLDQAHQPDESIGREAFESGAEIVLRVLERLCGARTRSR